MCVCGAAYIECAAGVKKSAGAAFKRNRLKIPVAHNFFVLE